jgi:TonB-linked SusC/RagA family outer membrane protein
MEKAERKISSATTLNIVLNSNAVAINEVVVTAMGVKQEKKKLNFAVQSVNSDIITEGQSANFVNSLQGQIAGVSVTNSGGSPNSGSQIIIRSISSINSSQNNQPLFILDGQAISGGAADINPNDIANITVLKGAAASALYGQDAANGAIMITTKQGASGKLSVSANAGWQIDNAVRVPRLQSIYGPGSLGFYKPEASGGFGGWGPLLNSGEKIYDNIGNYFKTGLYQKYDLSLTGGSEKFQAYASANYSSNEGIVPNDYLKKMGILVKGTYQINSRLSVSMMANVVNNTYRGASGVSTAYLWPINNDITNYKNEDGTPRFRYLSENDKTSSPLSPLWSRYMDSGVNSSTRNILQSSVNYKAFRNFEITGRLSFDQNNYSYDGYSVPRFDDSVILPELDSSSPTYQTDLAAQYLSPYLTQKQLDNIDKNLLGSYTYSQSTSKLFNASVITNYKITVSKDMNVELLAGAEMKTRTAVSSSLNGRNFIVPGIYSISNVSEILGVNDVSLNHSERRNAGVFGEFRVDYKGIANLSVTSRWDWSSTLALEFSPYYYPSITGGLIFSELFDIKNDWFSFGKLRGNWARVGKDAPSPYLFDRKYTQYPTLPDGGYGVDPSMSVASLLVPEMSNSWEIGLETRFFDNKTHLDIAYYSTGVDNQIVTVRVSPASGYILQTRNEGSIENHGLEITLDQNILKTKDLSWTAAANFSLNRGTVVSLPDGIVEIQGTQYGDIFPTSYLNGSTTAISGKDYLRTTDGKVICGTDGLPKINPTKSVVIGNREPDFLLGLSTRLQYKGFTLAILFDGRSGGDVVNVTGRGLWSGGQAKALEFYRGRQVVWDGVVQQSDGTYVKNTTPIVLDYQTISNYYTAVSSNFIEDGSYIRLSHVALGYDFSKLIMKNGAIKGLKCTLTGTNLFLLTKYTGTDPQLNASPTSGGTGSMGIDNYSVPNTRGFNFTINANF